MLLSCYHTYLNYKITLQRESFEKKYHWFMQVPLTELTCQETSVSFVFLGFAVLNGKSKSIVLQASMMSVNSSKFHSHSCRVWGFRRTRYAISNLTSVSTVMMTTSHVMKKKVNNELERLWPNSRYYPSICLKQIRKTTVTVRQDSQSPGRVLKPLPSEYEGVLTTQPLCFVNEHIVENLRKALSVRCWMLIELFKVSW
jgi:hypothetical protein